MSRKKLPPVHPGKILKDELIVKKANLKTLPKFMDNLTQEKCRVDLVMAKRLGNYFGTSPDFWMNLQRKYDQETADVAGR